MRPDDASAVKRLQTSDDEHIYPSAPKRLKLENIEKADEYSNLRRKPATQGVQQIPYPPNCRMSCPSYASHRKQLIADMKARLALQNKFVTRFLFLDDAVAFDWVYEKSEIGKALDNISNDCDLKYASIQDSQLQLAKFDDMLKIEDEKIPGLHLYNSGLTVDISEGSMTNPILVTEGDATDESSHEYSGPSPFVPEEARDQPQNCLSTVTEGTKGRDPQHDSSALTEEPSDMPVSDSGGMDRGSETLLDTGVSRITSEGQASTRSSVIPLPFTWVPTAPGPRNGHEICSVQDLDQTHEPVMIAGQGQRQRSSSSSSFSSAVSSRSSSSSTSSTSAGNTNSERLLNESSAPSQSKPDYDRYESLRSFDWRNCQSILFIWNLTWTSTLDDVESYLRLNNLPFPMILETRVHRSDSKTYRPIASVLFKTSSEAAKALRVLRNSNMPFVSTTEGNLERVAVEVELCQPPGEWKEDLPNVLDRREENVAAFHPRHSSGCRERPLQSVIHIPSTKQASMTVQNAQSGPSVLAHLASHDSPSSSANAGQISVMSRSFVQTRSPSPTGMLFLSGNDIPSRSSADRTYSSDRRHISADPSISSVSKTADIIDLSSSSDTHTEIDELMSSSDLSTDEDSDDSSLSDKRTADQTARRVRRPSTEAITARNFKQIQLPSVKYGRARRLLLSPCGRRPLMSVSMRGDVQFIDQIEKKRLVEMSLPAKASEFRRLEDACISGVFPILGFSKGNNGQASIVCFTDEAETRAEVSSLTEAPHNQDGILSLAPFRPPGERELRSNSNTFEFLSGGYDKTVHLWHVSRRDDEAEQPRFSSRITPLTRAPLNTKISALLQLPGTTRVLVAAGQRLWTLDAEWRAPPLFTPFSNFVTQLHIPSTKDPNVFIIELDHLQSQMQVFDVRMSRAGSGKPVLEFGYPESMPDVRDARSQKRRGDSSIRYFCRGFHDGAVCSWDYRDVRKPLFADKSDCPVTHTIFAGRKTRNLWTYARDKVRFLELDER